MKKPARHLNLGNIGWDPKARGPNGRRLCKWCKKEVPAGRICWCSAKCIHEGLLRAHGDYMRRHVHGRDRGVCGRCGLDTEKLQKLAHDMNRVWLKRQRSEEPADRQAALYWRPSGYYSIALTVSGKPIGARHLWEAHHKLAVAEGGGSCGLEDMMTLCIWCHSEVTGELRRRLNAAAAGPAKQEELTGTEAARGRRARR